MKDWKGWWIDPKGEHVQAYVTLVEHDNESMHQKNKINVLVAPSTILS